MALLAIKFILIQDPELRNAWINPDRINSIQQAGGQFIITMMDGDIFTVWELPKGLELEQ